MRAALTVIVAYLAGVWNGRTDSWWVVGAATVMVLVATITAARGQAASPRQRLSEEENS